MTAATAPGLPEPTMIASSPQVSAQMSRHPRKDTEPEVALRRLLHAGGLRYRIHQRVPGMARRTIDIAFPRARVAVFVDGCFWHGCPEHGMVPRSNSEWWRSKIEKNRCRDEETTRHLVGLGWLVLRFWCHEPTDAMAEAVAAEVAARRASASSTTAQA